MKAVFFGLSLLLGCVTTPSKPSVASAPQATSAGPVSMAWKLKVFDQTTREERVFVPSGAVLELPIFQNWQCQLAAEQVERLDVGERHVRHLACGRDGVVSGTTISCGITNRGAVVDEVSSWTGYDKDGRHVVTVIVECS